MASLGTSGGRSAVPPPGGRPQRGGVHRDHAAGEDLTVGAGDLDGVALVEDAYDFCDAGRQQRRAPLDRARRAPSSTTTTPASRWRRRSTACGPAGDGRGRGRWCPRRARRRRRRRARRAVSALAITARTPDHDAMRAAAQLRRHAAAAPGGAGAAPAPTASTGSSALTSSISVADGLVRGSAVNRPWRVGEQHEHVGATRCATSAAIRSLSP